MNIHKILLLASTALAMASCGKEAIETEFKINADIAENVPAVRAPQLDEKGAGSFASGDKNTLLFLNSDNQVVKSMEYTYGNKYFWLDINLPSGMKTCKVAGWYPAVKTETPEAFKWDITTTEEDDFLYAAPVHATTDQKEAIQLSFKHLMHKLQVKVLSGDSSVTESDLSNATVTCKNYHPAVTLNLLNGTVGAASGTLQSQTQQKADARFLLPAQPAGTIEIEVSIKGKTASFKLAETTINGNPIEAIESGKTLIFTLTATKGELKLTDGQNIDGWENQGNKNDNIIL